jgi:carbon-monoxide dehydrogenase medium subunit
MLTLDAGRCQDVRIGYCNVGLDAFRLAPVETLLEGNAADSALLSRAGELAMQSVAPPADVHADAAYRRDLVRTLTVRVLEQALGRAERGS